MIYMYYCFMDFDGTLTSNFRNLNQMEKEILNNYLKNNELCIITEEKYEIIKDYLKNNGISCDIAAIGSNTLLFKNEIIKPSIEYDKVIRIYKLAKNDIYTAYFEYDNRTEIINYQERLEPLYPKINREIVEFPSGECNSIFIAISIILKNSLIDLLNNINLSYVSYGEDKNRIILKISSSFTKKEDIFDYLGNYLKNKKTIGISDSSHDIPIIDKCDIKLAMKNGDKIIKNKYQNTIYDCDNSGALLELKNISKL